MKRLGIIVAGLILCFTISAKEYHVAKTGNDDNDGGINSPFPGPFEYLKAGINTLKVWKK